MSTTKNTSAKPGRKKRALIVALALVVLSAGAAFAYWTTGGSGTGTATTGTVADISVTQTSTISDMHPGDSPQTLSGTFTNTNAAPVYVATVTASISSVDKTGCTASDYDLVQPIMTVGSEVVTGDTWGGATIQFKNSPTTNQDACKGATVNLLYTVG